MSNYYLYRISVPDGKSYIGITNCPKKRFDEHCGAESGIGQAIRRHGRDKCKFEILRESDLLVDIQDWEQRYIKFFKTRHPAGYNYEPAPKAAAGRELFLESVKISPPPDALGDVSGVDAIFTPAQTPDKLTNAGWIEMKANSVGIRVIERVFPDHIFRWETVGCPRAGWRSTVVHVPSLAQKCWYSLRSELIGLSRLATMDDEELAQLVAQAVREEGGRTAPHQSNRGTVHRFFQNIAPANGGSSHRDNGEDVP